VRPGFVRAAIAVVVLSVTIAGCTHRSRVAVDLRPPLASVEPAANPGSGPFVVPVACHGDSSDADTLQRAINASSSGATIAIGGLCRLTKSITLLPDRSYTGSTPTGTVLRQAASMDFVLASSGYVHNYSSTGDPLSLRDLTVACNGSGQTNGIIVLNWLADVEHVNVTDCGGSGIVDSSRTANGTLITNTSVNSRFDNNFISGSGRYGFYVNDPETSVTDGYLEDNQIASSGGDAIHMDDSSGWTITGNHLYGVGQNAIYASRLYGTTISDNYIEDFGSKQNSGTWYGIEATAQGDTGSTISGNKVFNNNGESRSAKYIYIGITQVNSGTSYLAVNGNVIVGVRPDDVGLSVSGGSHHLVVASQGNEIANVGTATRHYGNVIITGGS
jgi:Right handed beta helix region